MGFISYVGVKSKSTGDAAVTGANHVLCFPLTISTRRVESKTSKATDSDEASVLAKCRSEEGSQKPKDLTLKSKEEWVVLLQEHLITLKNALLEKVGKKTSSHLGLGFLHKVLFIGEPLPMKCSKYPSI